MSKPVRNLMIYIGIVYWVIASVPVLRCLEYKVSPWILVAVIIVGFPFYMGISYKLVKRIELAGGQDGR